MHGKRKGKRKAARRQAEESTTRAKKNGPEREQTQAVAGELLIQPVIDQEDARPLSVRPDSRATRAARDGKKYINVLIDAELQVEVRVRDNPQAHLGHSDGKPVLEMARRELRVTSPILTILQAVGTDLSR